MISVENLKFSYDGKTNILDIPSMSVNRGERIFLHGPSGSGKSTFLGVLAGIFVPTEGSVELNGTKLEALSNSDRDHFRGSHLGYIFQMFNLIPYLTVEQNITLTTRLNAERRQRLSDNLNEEVVRISKRLGIDSLLAKNVSDLSVGQQQRVATARALLGSPEVVIADEPTSALDEDHRQQFIELLLESAKSANSTIVFVSHDRTLQKYFDRVISLPEINRVKSSVKL